MQHQLAEIYCTTKQNIRQHIDNLLNDGELDKNWTYKQFLLVRHLIFDKTLLMDEKKRGAVS